MPTATSPPVPIPEAPNPADDLFCLILEYLGADDSVLHAARATLTADTFVPATDTQRARFTR